ncbi:MAG: sugar phosphate isomerase/epimerase, partial [Atopobium sp.]|nr:sugar phosphate isomerase/epimerase [Atopobium sp.]
MFDKIPPICAMNCHYRFYTLEYFFRSARDNGYKEVEIWTGPMHYYVDCRVRENISKLLDLENQYQIKVIGICPEQTNPKPNNIAALSEEGQIRTLNYFKNEIDAAKLVKANQVVITSGWGYLDQPIQLSWNSSVQMLRKISEYAEQQGIPLAIEALQKKESNLVHTAAELKRLIADVDRPALKVCLDIGAMAA